MSRHRSSIANLQLFVGLAILGLAALRVSSRLWANLTFSVALTALVASVAGVIYHRGPRRAYWAGFALFGWPYLMIAFGPTPFSAWRDLLITTPVLTIVEEQLMGDTVPKANVPGPRLKPAAFVELTPWSHWTSIDRSNPFAWDSFNRIGHSFFTLAIAMVGGIYCRRLREARQA